MTRVVKIGGSLLQFRGLVRALREWLAAQPPAVNIIIAGGGAMADVIRQADSTFHLGEQVAHELCLDVMQITARLMSASLPEAPLLTEYRRLRHLLAQTDRPNMAIFDCKDFLANDEPHLAGATLPRNWSVTSDSIAARLANALGVGEVVLLKSTDPPGNLSREYLADCNYVDNFFPTASAGVAVVRCVNLRSQTFSEWRV